jgi:hypothetical protein
MLQLTKLPQTCWHAGLLYGHYRGSYPAIVHVGNYYALLLLLVLLCAMGPQT